jgi:hypothetical protein
MHRRLLVVRRNVLHDDVIALATLQVVSECSGTRPVRFVLFFGGKGNDANPALGRLFVLLFCRKKERTCSNPCKARTACFSLFVVYISKCVVVTRIQRGEATTSCQKKSKAKEEAET